MTTRTPVPATLHQSILNASKMTDRAATATCGWTTWESACQSEVILARAIDDLKEARRSVKLLKQQIRRDEIQAANDRAVVARSRKEAVCV